MVVECLVQDGAVARALAEEFIFNLTYGLQQLFCEEQAEVSGGRTLSISLVRIGIEGLTNLARSSRLFREALKDLPNTTEIFDVFKRVFSKQLSKRLEPDQKTIRDFKYLLSSVVASLAFSADSQMWALERGLLDVICAVYEGTHRREIANSLVAEDNNRRSKCPARKCNMVLLRLVETEGALRKLQQLDALSSLKVYKGVIDAAQAGSGLIWRRIQAGLAGKVPRVLRQSDCGKSRFGSKSSYSDEQWRFIRRVVTSGNFHTQTVCSWEHFAAGPEPDSEGLFSKCARCQVARYCRWA